MNLNSEAAPNDLTKAPIAPHDLTQDPDVSGSSRFALPRPRPPSPLSIRENVNQGQHRAWTQYTGEQRVESTQWVYSKGLVVVSARTNKSHHHHQDVDDVAFYLFLQKQKRAYGHIPILWVRTCASLQRNNHADS
jgi:hypothetical protein